MNLPSNLIRNSNDEPNLPHKILLTETQVSKICKAFANGSSANMEFSKTHLSKMMQPGRCIGIFNPINPVTPIEILPNIANKAEDLSKKVTVNYIIKQLIFLKNL